MAPDGESQTALTPVRVPVGTHELSGDLGVPPMPRALVLFAHGSGSSRHSPRNQFVARYLRENGFATLLIDLLTPEEEEIDDQTAEYRFDIEMLGKRMVAIVEWLHDRGGTASLPIGLFGASTGAAAALIAAAERPALVRAVVSRGGRPDLAGDALERVTAKTLFIVGGDDEPVIQMNEDAMRHMHGTVHLEIVPGATHLFEEPGALEYVAELAARWFAAVFAPPEARPTTEPAAARH